MGQTPNCGFADCEVQGIRQVTRNGVLGWIQYNHENQEFESSFSPLPKPRGNIAAWGTDVTAPLEDQINAINDAGVSPQVKASWMASLISDNLSKITPSTNLMPQGVWYANPANPIDPQGLANLVVADIQQVQQSNAVALAGGSQNDPALPSGAGSSNTQVTGDSSNIASQASQALATIGNQTPANPDATITTASTATTASSTGTISDTINKITGNLGQYGIYILAGIAILFIVLLFGGLSSGHHRSVKYGS